MIGEGEWVRDNATGSYGLVEIRSIYSVGPILSLKDKQGQRWRALESVCDPLGGEP